MTKHPILLLFCYLGLCADGGVAQPLGGKCRVAFRVVDNYGVPAPYKIESLKRVGAAAGAYSGLEAEVPCGKYSFQLERSDVKHQQGKIRGEIELVGGGASRTLNTDPTLLLDSDGRAFAVDRLPPRYPVTKGRVISGDRLNSGDYWVRFQSLTSGDVWEAKPDAAGLFSVSTQLDGLWMAVTFRGKDVVGVDVLEIHPAEQPVEVTLEIDRRLRDRLEPRKIIK